MALTAGDLGAGLAAAQATIAAAQARLGSLSLDEAALVDDLQFAAVFDPALLPLAIAAPAVAWLLGRIVADNRSADPGAQMRIDYGRRGSDPNLPRDEPAT